MATELPTPLTFSYRAQTREGQAISGSIDAASLADANQRLQALQLKEIQLELAPRPRRAKSLRGDDFAAFNQQLAQLTSAGLPIEQGLRLIAAEMGRGSLQRTLDMVAMDLERGKTLPQAIESHRAQFPALYGALVDAGIRAGNLPRILLNLGRHLTLVRRLQAMLWRTFSYPVFVMAAFCALFLFILVRVFPQFKETFSMFNTQLPPVTMIMMSLSDFVTHQLPAVVGGMAALLAVVAMVLWTLGRERTALEGVALRLPLVGPILRRSLISRWCDAVGLGVEAGMDLPSAISMADEAIGSRALRHDGEEIVAAVNAGRPMRDVQAGQVLPPMVISAIDLAAGRNNLPEGLGTLSQLYEQQAELRLGSAEVVLTPMVVVFMGILIGAMVLAMFAPMISLISSVSSPVSFHH